MPILRILFGLSFTIYRCLIVIHTTKPLSQLPQPMIQDATFDYFCQGGGKFGSLVLFFLFKPALLRDISKGAAFVERIWSSDS